MAEADTKTVGRTNHAVDRTNIHRVWRGVVIIIALGITIACRFNPRLLIAIAASATGLACARALYHDRDRYIPNLYARDVRQYDEPYQTFIVRTLNELRGCRIPGHPLLWEASRLPAPTQENSTELVLDLGVWIGWSTRLTADASGRKVYGFDTFEGLVEDWQIEDQFLIKRGTFSLSDPLAKRFIHDTGVSLQDGVPATLGRPVQFVKGSTYDTLEPFLTDHPGAPIRLFHMDLDTYESCLHGLETCKDRFVEGSILVFDEYLVTNGEMQAFFEFQRRYGIEWQYRTWGLEIGEMNAEQVVRHWKRVLYYFAAISVHLLDGRYLWKIFNRRFWRFWLGAPAGDLLFMLGAAGLRKSVSLQITGLGKLKTVQPEP